jgi:hypothetical protein
MDEKIEAGHKVSESNRKGEPQFTISRKADLVIQGVGTAPEPVVVKIDPNTGVIQFDRPRRLKSKN